MTASTIQVHAQNLQIHLLSHKAWTQMQPLLHTNKAGDPLPGEGNIREQSKEDKPTRSYDIE